METTTKSLRKKQQSTPSPILLRTVSEQADAKLWSVDVAIRGYHNQLKKENPQAAIAELQVQIPYIVQEYGVTEAIPSRVLAEATRLVLRKFGHFCIDDIREAFRQVMSGEITVKGAAFYGGHFDNEKLALVLGAYDQQRKKIIAAYQQYQEAKRLRRENEEKIKRLKAIHEKTIKKRILQAREDLSDWTQVYVNWYHECKRRGWFKLTEEEKQQYWQRAGKIAAAEGDLRKERRTVIGMKLIVWEKVINSNHEL